MYLVEHIETDELFAVKAFSKAEVFKEENGEVIKKKIHFFKTFLKNIKENRKV